VERVNVFTAESLEGRVDVGQALGSKATLMFIYDPAPDQSQSLYHYEYDEEWLLVVEGTVVVRAPDGEHTLVRGDLVRFPPGPAGAHKLMNEPQRLAGEDDDVLELARSRRLRLSGQRQGRDIPRPRERAVLRTRQRSAMVARRGGLGQNGLT
jgi:hypothetical protein